MNKLVTASIITLAALGACVEPNRTVSQGERVGVVRKFSLKESDYALNGQAGAQAWEGQLDMAIPGTAGGEVFIFSVEPTDQHAIEAVKLAMRQRAPVALQYRQWLRTPQTNPGSGCQAPRNLQTTPYTVYDVQALGSTAESIR